MICIRLVDLRSILLRLGFSCLIAAIVVSYACSLVALEKETKRSFAENTDAAAEAAAATPKNSTAKKSSRSLSEQLRIASRKATSQSYLLTYKFKTGEKFYWTVEHGVKTETSIQGKTEISRSFSTATKKWEVMDVSKEGVTTLIYSLVDTHMRHRVSELTDNDKQETLATVPEQSPELVYDSRSTKEVPDEYKHIAEAIGLSLATIEIKPSGEVVRKQTNYRDIDFGMGDFTISLPTKAVKIGYQWEVPGQIVVRLEGGNSKRLTTRKVYELTDVTLGVATITMRTEVLTPIHDPNIESQIVQKMTKGTIKFDIDNGRVMSREFNWDEQVQGFRVPDSLMIYQAQLSENYVEYDKMQSDQKDARAQRKLVKGPDAQPIFRK